MFPLHSAPTRLGIEQGLRGEAHRGPGCYEKDVVSIMQCKLCSSLLSFFHFICTSAQTEVSLSLFSDDAVSTTNGSAASL